MLRVGGKFHPAKDIAAVGVCGDWLKREEFDAIPSSKGAYGLLLRLAHATPIDLPRRAPTLLASGWYLYVGSAWGSGGLRARVGRHFSANKKPHWHIDRLTTASAELSAVVVADAHECELVAKLLKSPRFEVALAGFGSTDCRVCESHLLALSKA